MPCGGIWPVDERSGFYTPSKESRCWQCGESGDPGPWSFIEEWDAHVHDKCIADFLKSREGELLLSHGHEIILRAKTIAEVTLSVTDGQRMLWESILRLKLAQRKWWIPEFIWNRLVALILRQEEERA